MDWVIGVIVVVAIIILIVKNKKKLSPKCFDSQHQSNQRRSAPEQTDCREDPTVAEVPAIKLSISMESRSFNVDTILANGESVSRVDLGYRSESGGYVNWAVYSVKGKNTATKRMNTKHYKAKSRDSAMLLAKSDGLVEPFEVTCLPHSDDPEKRKYFLEKLNAYGVVPPDGAVIDDLQNILDRVRYSDDIVSEDQKSNGDVIRFVRPIQGPNAELARYADDMGIRFSFYISGPALFSQIVSTLPEREKAAFFAYCVLCHHKKIENIGDLRKTEFADQLYAFADVALNTQDVLKSIMERNSSDYLYPHKGTKAYKAVADFFEL